MKKIHVLAAHPYDVCIESGCLARAGAYLLPHIPNGYAAIVTDSTVDALYASQLEAALLESGIRTVKFVFPHGEASKTANTYLALLSFLAQNHISRGDAIIALGGGVVGDLAGFAAATYLRGIAFIQIPTTLLAMVDSSVGGKTAIDLPEGKNLVGAFHQPRTVLCDPDVLSTLPEEIFADGCAEVIKYGVLGDSALFQHLLEKGPAFDRAYVLECCIGQKSRIVAEDEFDTGARQKLNLGHTVGHAIEKESNFSLSHGKCVAIGMAIVAKSAAAAGLCEGDVYTKITKVLTAFGLPVKTEMAPSVLYQTMLSDKKRKGDTITLVLPEKIGHAVLWPVPLKTLSAFIEAGF